MLLRLLMLLPLLALTALLYGQTDHPPTCAQKEFSQQLYRVHPEFKKTHDVLEAALYIQRTKGLSRPPSANFGQGNHVVLPVVVHIIHQNGQEDISDDQVRQGIKYLNEAYAASGYYNADGSTNTEIQFCMAQRDPNGNATNGITRNVSSYTVMGGNDYAADDQHVKNIIRWNPYNYINIWLVKSIPGDVVGYSTLPEAHGTQYEGIVMEAQYFGSSEANNVVLIHEVGHYLGMYHTFDGGCTNNNCQLDGDKVCDTPPDQSTAYIGCESSMNSCTTDVLSGFNTDQPDLTQDYMDYGNFNCMKVFTPGQSERMNWFIQNVLFSLLNCKSCQMPCLSPARAVFTASAQTVQVNTSINFTNHSVNAANYIWFVDGVRAATTKDFSRAFAVQGRHVIKLQANSGDVLCDSAITTDTIVVTCPVKAAFTWPPGIIKMGQTVVFSNTSQNANSYTWKVDKITNSNSAAFSYTFAKPGIYNVTLVAYGICTDSVTQPVSVYDSLGHIPSDICKPITFQKLIVNNNQVIYGMNTTHDSGYILSGFYAIPFVDSYGGAYAVKMNKAGSVEWAQYMNPINQDEMYKIHETPDNNFIMSGRQWGMGDLHSKAILIKLSPKGDAIWAKKFGRKNSVRDVAFDITQTADGGYAFCGATYDDDFKSTNWLVSKMDVQGNITWTKELDNGFYERAYSILTKGDTLIIAGIRTLAVGPRSQVVVIKMLADNGKVVQSMAYGIGGRSVENTTLYKIAGGYLVGAESVADGFYYADMDQLALELDENLQPTRAVKVAIDVFGSIATGINPTPDGGFVTARNSGGYSGPYTDSSWMSIAKVAPDWTIEWIKQYPLAYVEGHTVYTTKSVYPTPDGGYVTGETLFRTGDYGEHFRIIKTAPNGATPGCIVKDFKADMQVQDVNPVPFTWTAINDVVFDDPVSGEITNLQNSNQPPEIVQRCITSDCSSLKLKGSTAICRLSDTITYAVDRNAACVSNVLWGIDSNSVSVVGSTDTTIRLLFKKTGMATLFGRIATACAVLQDSMVITVNNSPATLNLGPDIALCTNSTVRLSAGYGFKNYQWNTGNTDSIYTAYLPGKYYVTVNDYCGNTFSDTILISTAPAIKLNLFANLPRCDKDSVMLSAAPNFKSYSWSPNYNISSVSSNQVTVWPAKDTTYTVVAVINDHCTVTDSTRIRILQSAPISIGNDTSFCTGGVALLQAPPGFNGYLWQDGSTGTTYNATQQGMYRLNALNDNGCYSKDTMLVTEVFPLPPVNLGKDGALCLNNTVLHAGSGQKSYAWQDGSTDSVFTVSATGKYWVTVTGGHDCINADTVAITSFNPVPAGFLADNAALCENGTLQLTAIGRWVNYLWNDASVQPSITIKQPGQYWLQVTDNNACKGRDTITVTLKPDCPKVIYFPNAFTPNGDGHNDYFKPFAGAPMEKYNLQIYNRWGQKIFESNDPLNGWDGAYKGALLNTGSYIYFCRYKFFGEAEGVVKGSVVVVR